MAVKRGRVSKVPKVVPLYSSQQEYELASQTIQGGEYRKGVYHLRVAAEAGHLKAQYELGSWIVSGTKSIQADPREALYWFSRCALSGHDMSLLRLGLCYYHGIGTQKDYGIATSIFQKTMHIDAKFLLAVCYAKGHGVLMDMNAAMYWCDYAAKNGHSQGKYYQKYFQT